MHPAPDSPDPRLPAARRMPSSTVLPTPRFRYSPVVVAGGFAFVSGLVGLDASTGTLAGGGAYGEARQILDNFAALCDEQGWSLDQLVVETGGERIEQADPALEVVEQRGLRHTCPFGHLVERGGEAPSLGVELDRRVDDRLLSAGSTLELGGHQAIVPTRRSTL